jgi:hypothetical protein
VAQLGARFHGMEEVKGSNPFRSTKSLQTLTVPFPANYARAGVQLESEIPFTPGCSVNLLPAHD